MIKINIIIIFLSFNSFGQDIKPPCGYFDRSLQFDQVESFNCEMSSKVVHSDLELQKRFRDYTDKKMATKLAQSVSEAIEDIALLDSFFEHSGISIGQHEEVRSSCVLEKIATPECVSGISHKKNSERINLIKNNISFTQESKVDDVPDSLLGRLQSKFRSIRHGKSLENSKGTCPVDGSSGAFILSSFLSEKDALRLIDRSSLESDSQSFPHLKLLSKNSQLKKTFESFLKSYDPSKGSAKNYLDTFFNNSEVQDKLGMELAKKCNSIKKNINKFTCQNDLTTPAIKEEDIDFLFGDRYIDSNGKLKDFDQDPFYNMVARGFSCKIEKEFEENGKINISNENNPFLREGAAGNILSSLIPDLRVVLTPSKARIITDPFCEKFLCKSESIKPNMLSCKNGGPISSYDLLKTCEGNENLKCEEIKDDNERGKCFNNGFDKCQPKVQQYLSYLKMKERDAINSGNIPKSLAGIESFSVKNSSDGSEATKSRGFSSFYQNFLGVEGTLLAEGKTLTPAAIENKRAEFAEKKIGSESSQNFAQKIEPKVNPSVSLAPGAENNMASTQAQARIPSGQDNFVTSNSSIQERKTSYQTVTPRKVERPSGFTQSSFGSDSNTTNDIKELQKELAKVVKGLDGSDEQNLKTVSQNNQAIVGGSAKSNASASINDMTRAERERLDRYRQSLGAWENRLQNWSSDLRQREVQGFSGAQGNESPKEVIGNSSNGKSVSQGNKTEAVLSTSNGANKAAKKGEGAIEQPADKFLADDGSIILNSENLSSFGRETLSKIGIYSQESFILNVRHENRIYAVPVQTFKHRGKNIFVPLLNEKNRNLAKIIIESPLFSDYRIYRAETEVSSL